MTDNNYQQMADILPLPAAQSFHWPWLVVVFLLLITVFLIWRYYRNPYVKLRRQLQQNNVNTRQIAHDLAKLPITDKETSKALDDLRFKSCSPNKQALSALIKKLQHAK